MCNLTVPNFPVPSRFPILKSAKVHLFFLPEELEEEEDPAEVELDARVVDSAEEPEVVGCPVCLVVRAPCGFREKELDTVDEV